ncbi:MAG TPA: S8 family serine peptidase, partial [Lacipirellulaceae bacterium]|nr:S8 family serine peptidase [Lacipirellulaceae bacterium]
MALSAQPLAEAGVAASRPVFPDGLNHADPVVRSALASITTTGATDVYFQTADPHGAWPADAEALGAGAAADLIGATTMWQDPRFAHLDGQGYSIVILDTGIDVNHPFFGPDLDDNGIADRIVHTQNFVNPGQTADDINGHGTHVASIAASSDLVYGGLAPGANIIALKVISDLGTGTASAIEDALQWVAANVDAYNIVAVNMSLETGTSFSAPNTFAVMGIADELAAIALQDVIIVSASGNSNSPTANPGVSYPSADPNSLSIGATWIADVGGPFTWLTGAIDITTGEDRITSFSQRHPAMTTVFAPGAPIVAAGAGGHAGTLSPFA